MGKAPSLLHCCCHVWREGRSGGYANPCCGYGYERRSARTYPYLYPCDTRHVTCAGYPYPWYSLLTKSCIYQEVHKCKYEESGLMLFLIDSICLGKVVTITRCLKTKIPIEHHLAEGPIIHLPNFVIPGLGHTCAFNVTHAKEREQNKSKDCLVQTVTITHSILKSGLEQLMLQPPCASQGTFQGAQTRQHHQALQWVHALNTCPIPCSFKGNAYSLNTTVFQRHLAKVQCQKTQRRWETEW